MPDSVMQTGPESEEVRPATPSIETSVHGAIGGGEMAYARTRMAAVIDRISEPVLFARLRLTLAADPAQPRPAMAQATIDVDGEPIRAHVAAHEIREAADLLQRRLLDKLEHRAAHRRALRRRGSETEPGEWRHGDAPTARPQYFDRPVEERQLVRHKTFTLDELTPDEAAFDLDQLDFDFHLFRDLTSGEDAVIERLPDGSFRLTRLHPVDVDPGPTAIDLQIEAQAPIDATVQEAISHLDSSGEPFVFFGDAASGRGHVVYRRFDGHYGLITPS